MLTHIFSDPDHANFEFAHFLFGTHYEEGSTMPNTLNLGRMRVPKISSVSKNIVDYKHLDRKTHSKMELVRQIPHDGEVIKARECP